MWMVQGSDSSFTVGGTRSVQKRLTNTPSYQQQVWPAPSPQGPGRHTCTHTHILHTSYSSETKQLLSRLQPSEVTVSAMDLWLGWVTSVSVVDSG